MSPLDPAGRSERVASGQEKFPGQMGPLGFLKDGDFPSLHGARGQGESRGLQRCHQIGQAGRSLWLGEESARTRERKALSSWWKTAFGKRIVNMGLEKKKKPGGKLQ